MSIDEVRAVYRTAMEEIGVDPDLIDEIQDAVRDRIYPEEAAS